MEVIEFIAALIQLGCMMVVPMMMTLGIGALVALGLWNSAKTRKRRIEFAKKNGWHYSSNEIRGAIDGRKFRVRWYTRGSGKNSSSYTKVTFDNPIPGLVLQREGFLSLGKEEVIGDDLFDKRFRIKGPPQSTVWLAAPLRKVLLREPNLLFDRRHIGVDVRGHTSLAKLPALIRRATLLAQAVPNHTKAAEALESHLASEPEPKVVAYWLSQLDPKSDRAHTLASSVSHRNEPEIRLAVAVIHRDLAGIREVAGDARAEGRLRARAITALIAHGDRAHAASIIATLDWPPKGLVHLLKGIGKHTPKGDLQTLQAALTAVKSLPIRFHGMALGKIAPAVARQGPEAESMAIRMLAVDDTPTEQILVPWLSRHGTTESVQVLRDVQSRAGLLFDGSKAMAEKAIRAIQARASGEAGGLALAEPTGGGLSEAAEHGGLSPAAKQKHFER